MRILFCSNEAAPIYKLGGLGDVSHDLPKSLSALGCDIRLAIPFHPEIKNQNFYQLCHYTVTYNSQSLPVSVFLSFLPHTKIPIYLFSQPRYIHLATDALDTNIEKAAVFSLAVAGFCQEFNAWQPHLLHLNDWHTSLIPVFLKHQYNLDIPSLITIHNHHYTGTSSLSLLPKLSLPHDSCRILKWDQEDGELNLLMEGVAHADAVNTVSPSYRQQLLAEKTQLAQILNDKSNSFFGILNGIDYSRWSPATDSFLSSRYHSQNWRSGKKANKLTLQKSLGLTHSDLPLIIFVGRVDSQQKGIPLIIEALNQHVFHPEKCQFIFLGVGDSISENLLHQAGDPQSNIKIITRYDEALAHQLYAAGDFIIIPSDYEPCGLIQLIAMHYGTIPVAHKTGGLIDTIQPETTGFLYTPNQLDIFSQTLLAALTVFSSNQIGFYIHNCFRQNFDWEKPSQAYLKIYHILHNF